MRRTVHPDLLVGLLAAVGLITALVLGGSLGWLGVALGGSCAAALTVLVALGLAASGRPSPGPADRVTLTRAVLACGVAAVVADTSTHDGNEGSSTVLVVLAAVALGLDAVDGRVARRTGTTSAFGARFDMECDAFLVLVLAVHVSRGLGWWVLLIGAARYLLLLAQRALPWLRGAMPARRWRRAVAAYVGVSLTVAASGSVPHEVAAAVVGSALVALLWSFGTEAGGLWRQRGLLEGTDDSVHRDVAPDVPGLLVRGSAG
ncbi:CDP-alcohol phosphatidyltransferase family protein [Terrabacter sp. BE26]|uniref:CDP-alcohol phosphatidyltransferase family protein n=1 Tax=Terrabacter sp. BE26 TaxID=2898152 RepID=UPI0035BE6CBD